MSVPERQLSQAISFYHQQFVKASEHNDPVVVNKQNVPKVVSHFSALLTMARTLEDKVHYYDELIAEAKKRAIGEGFLNAERGDTIQ